MDILAALDNETPAIGADPCVIQKWLDTIADNTPGRDDLVTALTTTDPVDPNYRTLSQLAKVLRSLGLITSEASIGDHRSGRRCRCHG